MSRNVLVIDDDETDVLILTHAFRSVDDTITVHHAVSGDDGLTYLQQNRPDLVLLDLKMPGVSGLEVLSSLKDEGETRNIPVIIFSSSHAKSDVESCYEAAANAYVVKPTTMGGYLKMASSLSHFWLDKVLHVE